MAPQQVTVQLQGAPASQPKPGWKTSEGILTVAVKGYIAAEAFLGNIPVPQAAEYMAVMACVYGIARMGLKAVHILGLAKNVPDLPENPTASA